MLAFLFAKTMSPPTNPHWARAVGYGPFSLFVIHKEGLCPRRGGINRLMMMKTISVTASVLNQDLLWTVFCNKGINVFSPPTSIYERKIV
jgi:hypothetical protein